MRTFSLALLGALGASGCGPQFTPETVVDSLRILAVIAEPPEVAPGEPSNLRIVQSDPSRAGSPNTVIWVGCEPDPRDLGRSACNDASFLLKPTLITDYPPGLNLLGFGATGVYRSTTGVFDTLEPDNLIRQTGSVGQVMAVVVGEDVPLTATGEELKAIFQRIENKETPTVVGISRVIVSQKPKKNQNPTISGLTFDGAPLPRLARLLVKAGQKVSLGVRVPDAARESYDELLSTGPVPKRESLVGAWYSSNGRFSRERFDVDSPEPTTFIAPGAAEFPTDPVPDKRLGSIWLVVRDNRGGQAYEKFAFYVCDPALPTPKVTSIVAPTKPGDPVIARGDDLAHVLDLVIGDVALDKSGYSPVAYNGFTGELPPLAPGSYKVSVRGKNCSNVETTLTYVVPSS